MIVIQDAKRAIKDGKRAATPGVHVRALLVKNPEAMPTLKASSHLAKAKVMLPAHREIAGSSGLDLVIDGAMAEGHVSDQGHRPVIVHHAVNAQRLVIGLPGRKVIAHHVVNVRRLVIGLRVLSVTGRPARIDEAILRNLLRVIDQLPGVYAIGILTMLVSSRNQRLGDLAAGTVVVHEKALSAPVMTVAAPIAGAAWTGGGLTEAELLLVETFLQRRAEIEPAIRERHAHAIAERLRARLGTSAPLLETLVYGKGTTEGFYFLVPLHADLSLEQYIGVGKFKVGDD